MIQVKRLRSDGKQTIKQDDLPDANREPSEVISADKVTKQVLPSTKWQVYRYQAIQSHDKC